MRPPPSSAQERTLFPYTTLFRSAGGEQKRTLARPLVRQQFKAVAAATLKAADGVPAEVVAASVVKFTLIYV